MSLSPDLEHDGLPQVAHDPYSRDIDGADTVVGHEALEMAQVDRRLPGSQQAQQNDQGQ